MKPIIKLLAIVLKKFTHTLPDLDEYDGDNFKLASSFNHFFTDKVQKARDHISNELNLIDESCPTLITNEQNSSHDSSPALTDFRLCDSNELIDLIRERGIKTYSKIDPLSSSTMKDCLDPLLPHLLDLINTSLKTGSIDGAKLAYVSPLIKNLIDADSLEKSSYRPISHLSFISKLIERIVAKRLNEHMAQADLHVDSQLSLIHI